METGSLLLTIAGTVIVLLLAVIGYFVKVVHSDVKGNTKDIGVLWGKSDLINQNAENKIDRLAERTELQLSHLTEQISKLTSAVEKTLAKNAA